MTWRTCICTSNRLVLWIVIILLFIACFKNWFVCVCVGSHRLIYQWPGRIYAQITSWFSIDLFVWCFDGPLNDINKLGHQRPRRGSTALNGTMDLCRKEHVWISAAGAQDHCGKMEGLLFLKQRQYSIFLWISFPGFSAPHISTPYPVHACEWNI